MPLALVRDFKHIRPTLAKIAEVFDVATVSVAAWTTSSTNAANGHLTGTRSPLAQLLLVRTPDERCRIL